MSFLTVLDVARLELCATLFEYELKKPGEVICREGEIGDAFYIVSRGNLEVSHTKRGKSYKLGTLAPGACFGEIALMENVPRSATVVASGESEVLLLRLSKMDFESFLSGSPTVPSRFLTW